MREGDEKGDANETAVRRNENTPNRGKGERGTERESGERSKREGKRERDKEKCTYLLLVVRSMYFFS